MSINPYFMFATGIENSYPTIGNGSHRVDEMAKCGHYDRWNDDFERVNELGIHFLRYGPPLHTTWLGEGRYDWGFADATFAELKRRNIVPIVDLCHFGVPDPERPRDTNRWSPCASRWRCCWTCNASPCSPRRISSGLSRSTPACPVG